MHAAFLADILEHPDDDTPRLVYADWLEENGDTDDALRAEFIRVQVKLARSPDEHLRLRERELWEMSDSDGWLIPDPVAPQSAHICLETETMALAETIGDALSVLVFRRGFVERVRFPLAAWLEYGPALVASHPIQRVELNDRRPIKVWLTRLPYWCWSASQFPAQLGNHLPCIDGRNAHGHWYDCYYTTEAEALDAASVACLAYARARNEEQANG